ncbi:HTH-type transcriptional regulator DmlR [compost metagenome]
MAPLLQAHSGLSLKLFFHDEQIDLIEQRIDLAIRVGTLEGSSLVARHIGDSRLLLCAAPSYLSRKPSIARPEDLIGLDWLALNNDMQNNSLTLGGPGGEVQRLRIESRVSCNNILAVRHFTVAGMGISLQPEQEIREELASGSLRVLLPDWQLPPLGIYLVTPRRDAQPAKVRYAIEALRQHLLAH